MAGTVGIDVVKIRLESRLQGLEAEIKEIGDLTLENAELAMENARLKQELQQAREDLRVSIQMQIEAEVRQKAAEEKLANMIAQQESLAKCVRNINEGKF